MNLKSERKRLYDSVKKEIHSSKGISVKELFILIENQDKELAKDLKIELDRRLFFDNGSKQYCDHTINKIFGLQDDDGGKQDG